MKRKLMQLIKQNARPDQAAPSIRMEAAADNVVHLYVFDVIDPWWGANAADLIKALADAAGRDVKLHINSPGGDVFESLAMSAAVAAYAGKVTALIEGVAASAATRLALSAAEVHITDGSLFMVHNAWTLAYGNKTELRDTATLLDKVDQGIAADYQRKTGATADQVVAWMDAETWFTATEAKDAGFVDQVLSASQASSSAQASAARWNLSAYANAPKLQAPVPQPKDEKTDALTARQASLHDALEDVVKEFGLFDQTSGPAGAHYMAPAGNPFGAEGLRCSNCAFYSGPRGCELVAGDIDPDALCKFWLIPADLLTQTAGSAAQAARLQKLNRSRLEASLLHN